VAPKPAPEDIETKKMVNIRTDKFFAFAIIEKKPLIAPKR
jgi:hypothetical protein